MAKSPRSKRRKKKSSTTHTGITRRSALKLGAAAGVVTVLTSKKSLGWQSNDPPEPPACFPAPANSPDTTPFAQALPIPPLASASQYLNPAPTLSANIDGGEAARADHQRWDEFLPQVLYDVDLQPALHNFHRDLPDTYVWGYNGIVPGPTFCANYGVPILVRFHNDLPPRLFCESGLDHTGPGTNTHTTHLHNGHTASESDGFAGDYWCPGLFKDHHYPNILAGYDEFPPTGDIREAMHTLWYHDHRHSFTSPNNYRGLNGMFFLFDTIDSGDENDPSPDALHLPSGYGQHDIPLILTDKKFCADGQLAFNTAAGGIPAGDKFIVNGGIQPFFCVKRRKYRFRILNTGPARIWTLSLINGNDGTEWAPWTVISTDGNLLASPVQVDNLEVNVSSRFDVVIDFTNTTIGDSVYILNNQAMFVSNPPPPPVNGVDITKAILRFDVTGDPAYPDNSQVPSLLTTYPDINLNEVVTTRIWDFELQGGVFKINGLTFDPDRADATVGQGTAETWILHNKATPNPGWTHPVHIHFEEGLILARNDNARRDNGTLDPLESGRRDVYPIRANSVTTPGGEKVLLFIRFRNLSGKYMIHCHNMNHEDAFMLTRWDIGATTDFNTSGQPNPDPPILSPDDPRFQQI